MPQQQLIQTSIDFAILIAYGLGLWIAVRAEPYLTLLLDPATDEGTGVPKSGRVLLSLALAYFISQPVIDLIFFVQSAIFWLTPALRSLGQPTVQSSWGTGPRLMAQGLPVLVMILSYAAVLLAARSYGSRRSGRGEAEEPAAVVTWALMLAVASAVWRGINLVMTTVVQLELPPLQAGASARGMVGFVGGWVVAAGLIALAALYLNAALLDLGAEE